MGLSGGFAFDVDEHGRSEVAMLGLKSNVGNMEGSYLLVCSECYPALHQTGQCVILKGECVILCNAPPAAGRE